MPFVKHSQAPWVVVAGGINRLGGTDKANLAMAEYLLSQGVQVYAATHRIDPELAKHPGMFVERVPIPGESWFAGERLLSFAGRKLARRVLRLHPEARVLVNGGNCFWGDLNWVHCVHNAWECRANGAPWAHRVKQRIASATAKRREAKNLGSARLIIANSELTRKHVITHLNVDPSRVQTVYLGTESRWAPPCDHERSAARGSFGCTDTPLVVFIGALGYDTNKGLDTLWRAWQSLCRLPEWDGHLIVAGAGRALPRWRAEISRSPFRDRVQVLGFTERIRDLLAAADLLVSPVRYESFGLNVQEALCRGVPAVVNANAGVAERYSPQLRELLLPDPEDVEDLVRRILMWRANIPYWRGQAHSLSKSLRSYTWAHMAERIHQLATEEAPAVCADYTLSHEGLG